MNNAKCAILILSLFLLAMFLTACTSREAREKAEQIRQWELDSVREVRIQDSLVRARFQYRLSEMRKALSDSLEVGSDCMRFSVMFGWPTLVGPCMSISPCREGHDYVLYVNAFDWRDHDDFERITLRKSISQKEFARFSSIMDSVSFENLSIVPLPDPLFDYQTLDGEQFTIERRKEGVYHGIGRSTPAELFVYDLFADASDLAGLPKTIGKGFRGARQRAMEIMEKRQHLRDSRDP